MFERLQRFDDKAVQNDYYVDYKEDVLLAQKIWALLGSRFDMHWGDCDAMYFDFSVIPRHLNLSRDAYFIFGITENAEFVSQWIDRWEFDK